LLRQIPLRLNRRVQRRFAALRTCRTNLCNQTLRPLFVRVLVSGPIVQIHIARFKRTGVSSNVSCTRGNRIRDDVTQRFIHLGVSGWTRAR
jgi:hypothetical protein